MRGTVLLTAIATGACSAPIAEPVFTTAVPTLETIPIVQPLPARRPPPDIQDELVLRVPPGPTAPDEFDIVNSPGAVPGPEGARPGAIIYAPGVLPPGGLQAVETALLRHGFAVLDQTGIDRRITALRDSLGAPPVAPGRTPDLAQVIRAVQSGERPADYLFLVERFTVSPASDRALEIGGLPETRAHAEQNPGLRIGDAVGEIPTRIPSRWYRTQISARLLDVGTGSIVWLGSHDVESPDAEPDGIVVRISTERRVANVDRINGGIADWNERTAEMAQEARLLQGEIRDVYAVGSEARTFDSEEAALAWQRSTRAEADRLEREYRDLLERLNELASSPPVEYEMEWDTYYVVDTPRLDPDFSSDGAEDAARGERIEAHLERLVRTVATSLINTIVIN